MSIKSNFFKVPNEIFFLTGMKKYGYTNSAFKVLLYLLSYQNLKIIHPSIRTISNKTNCSPRQVIRALKWLKEQRFIDYASGKSKHSSNTYIINFDGIDQACTKSVEQNKIHDIEQKQKRANVMVQRKLEAIKKKPVLVESPINERAAELACLKEQGFA